MILSLLVVTETSIEGPPIPQRTKAGHGSWFLENANQLLVSDNGKLTQEVDEGRQALMKLDHIQDQALAIIKEYTDKMMATSKQNKGFLLEQDQAINERDQAINE